MASLIGGIVGGGGGIVGGAIVRLTLDTSSFDTGLKAAEGKLAATGAKLSAIGGSMTKFVTLPIVAIGGVAVKMALDFEAAFTKIAAVTNTSAADIDAMKESVLALSGETARAPTELAEAMYFLASAGLSASQQVETLELSAKAAASGLGETQDIARLTANALNAYAESGLTAAQVTDTLVAAVREGTAEPAEFADALGRILPIAAAAGVSFDEVTASLSALSNVGLDVNEGVTAMRGLLGAMVAPGTQAANVLDDLGISTEQLRHVLSEGGLLAAMQLLMEKSGGNLDVLQDLVPNIRALTGELGIMGQDAEAVAGIFDRVKNSTGSLDKAFAKTAEGPMFKVQQAFAELKVALIELGTLLLPIATSIAKTLGSVAKAFSSLSPAMQSTVVKFGLILAAVGPVLKIFGSLLGSLGKVSSAISLLSTRIGIATGASTTFGAALTTAGIAAGVALIAIGFADAAAQAAQFRAGVEALSQGLLDGSTTLDEYRANLARAVIELEGSSLQAAFAAKGAELEAQAREKASQAVLDQVAALRVLPGGYSAVTAQVVNGLLAQGDYARALEFVNGEIETTKAALAEASAAFNAQRDATNAAKDSIQELTGAAHGTIAAEEGLVPPVEGATVALDAETSAAQAAAAALKETTDAAYAQINAMLTLAGGYLGVLGAANTLADAQAHLGDVQKNGASTARELRDASSAVLEAQLRLTGSVEAYAQSLFDAGVPQREVIALLQQQATKAGLTAGQTQGLINKVNALIKTNDAVQPSVKTEFTTPGLASALSGVALLRSRISILPKYTQLIIETKFLGGGGVIGGLAAGGIVRMADGGIRGIPHGAGGFITRAPTVLVGEGSGHTSFGRGAEAVIPLSDHTLRRLGRAIADASADKGGGDFKGDGGPNVYVSLPNLVAVEGKEQLAEWLEDALTHRFRRRETLRSG